MRYKKMGLRLMSAVLSEAFRAMLEVGHEK